MKRWKCGIYRFASITFEESPNRNIVKCVLVGSSHTGKTSLLTAYVNNKFPTEYIPTVFEHYRTDTMVDGDHCHLDISDTSGMEEYDKLRPLDYFETNVFLVCFCVVAPASFYDVRNKWVPEVTKSCKNTPFLLVGTQTDLRDDTRTIRKLAKRELQPISYEQGQHLANELGAFKYVECSALTQKGLHNVFEEALRVVIGTSKDKCLLM